MLSNLAENNYSRIPRRLCITVAALLVFGMLWLILPVSFVAKSNVCAFENNYLSIISAKVFDYEPLGLPSVIRVSEYGAPFWTEVTQTDIENILWGASFFVLFCFAYLLLTIFIRIYFAKVENGYSVLLNWIKSIKASTS